MPKRKIFDEEGHVHFVTFSCYKRRKWLSFEGEKGDSGAVEKGGVLMVFMPHGETPAATTMNYGVSLLYEYLSSGIGSWMRTSAIG